MKKFLFLLVFFLALHPAGAASGAEKGDSVNLVVRGETDLVVKMEYFLWTELPKLGFKLGGPEPDWYVDIYVILTNGARKDRNYILSISMNRNFNFSHYKWLAIGRDETSLVERIQYVKNSVAGLAYPLGNVVFMGPDYRKLGSEFLILFRKVCDDINELNRKREEKARAHWKLLKQDVCRMAREVAKSNLESKVDIGDMCNDVDH
jgi:hypothetical protein